MKYNGQTGSFDVPSLGVRGILGIETSCDETAASVLSLDGKVLSSVVASQHDVHKRFGGIVPELASRRHTERIEEIVLEAMNQSGMRWPDLAAIAATQGPGLAGALVVGVSFSKALAYSVGVPWIAVNHLQAHIASAWLEHPRFKLPCVVLVVSGGHTHLYLVSAPGRYVLIGRTIDDAAGEAFDKGAKMLGLDYPGGPAVDKLARSGDPAAVHFSRPYLKRGGLNFSFSGIKTALLYFLRDREKLGHDCSLEDIAAGYQEAIVEVLVEKTFRAVRQHKVAGVAVVGGVSANSRLRTLCEKRATREGVELLLPRIGFCTDNAAMVALAGWWAFQSGRFSKWDVDASATLDCATLSAGGASIIPSG